MQLAAIGGPSGRDARVVWLFSFVAGNMRALFAIFRRIEGLCSCFARVELLD